jgi:hypothetical protein
VREVHSAAAGDDAGDALATQRSQLLGALLERRVPVLLLVSSASGREDAWQVQSALLPAPLRERLRLALQPFATADADADADAVRCVFWPPLTTHKVAAVLRAVRDREQLPLAASAQFRGGFSDAQLAALAAQSDGDVRHALLALQFLALSSLRARPSPPPSPPVVDLVDSDDDAPPPPPPPPASASARHAASSAAPPLARDGFAAAVACYERLLHDRLDCAGHSAALRGQGEQTLLSALDAEALSNALYLNFQCTCRPPPATRRASLR